jgi:hypothetical protein
MPLTNTVASVQLAGSPDTDVEVNCPNSQFVQSRYNVRSLLRPRSCTIG